MSNLAHRAGSSWVLSMGLCALVCVSADAAWAQPRRPNSGSSVVPKTTEQIAALGRRATVTIIALDAAGDTLSRGSGVIIREDGIVVTNWHVMAGASRAKVRLASGEVIDRVMYLEGDSTADLALLRIATLGAPTAPTTPTIPEPGARVTVIGAPLGLSHSVSDGVVSATRLSDGKTVVQLTAAISPGSSGGPVFDGQGRVFAIVTSSIEAGQALNFAMPIRYALALLPLAGAPRPLEAVFASTSALPRSGATARSSGQVGSAKSIASGFNWPTPTERPTRGLEGAYRLTTRVASRPDAEPFSNGLVVLNGSGQGLLVISRTSGPALFMEGVVTTQSGRVAYKVLGDALATGFQTDSGFFALQPIPRDTMFLSAARVDLSLERPDGLYDVSTRTRLYWDDGREAASPIDWRGSAIVVATRDSLRMLVSLTNQAGGATAADAISAIGRDGFVNWRGADGSLLRGTVSGGTFQLEWVDRRDKMELRGMLKGQRR